MFELTATIIFFASLLGIGLIIYFKLPVLVTMPKNGDSGIRKNKLFSSAENKVKHLYSLVSDGIILHKFLSWSKCQILKAESWIDGLLHGIRKKAKEKKLNGKK